MTNDVKARTRAFLSKHVKQDALTDSADLFSNGFVNSLFALQLVLFVERTFGLTIENDDLDISNFRSIDAIAAFVSGKFVPVGRQVVGLVSDIGA